MGTLVERKSRFLLLTKVDYPDAEAVLEGFIRRMRTLPASLHKTLTYDPPNEMAHHWDLACPLRLRGHYRRGHCLGRPRQSPLAPVVLASVRAWGTFACQNGSLVSHEAHAGFCEQPQGQ